MLQHYGIQGSILRWFADYLTNRQQYVKFANAKSTSVENFHGVPQGSVLGPLLFIIYINDIARVVKNCEINLFADDAVLYFRCKNIDEAIGRVNADLRLLSTWMEMKHLKLNADKTEYVAFSSQRVYETQEMKINNECIRRVNSHKYLGVILDERLKFDEHLNYVLKKTGRKFGVMCRLNKSLNVFSKITVYKSLVSPHFEYCATILFLLNQSQIYELQKHQNKCMRLILKCRFDTPIKSMLDCLGWMSVSQRIVLKVLLFIKDIKDKKVPEYLLNEVITSQEVHPLMTR